jgi:hypothetical protein
MKATSRERSNTTRYPGPCATTVWLRRSAQETNTMIRNLRPAPLRRVIGLTLLGDDESPLFAIARLECNHEQMVYVGRDRQWPREWPCDACAQRR